MDARGAPLTEAMKWSKPPVSATSPQTSAFHEFELVGRGSQKVPEMSPRDEFIGFRGQTMGFKGAVPESSGSSATYRVSSFVTTPNTQARRRTSSIYPPARKSGTRSSGVTR